MTILGKQTVDEVKHLMKTVEFRIEQVQKLMVGMEFSPARAHLVGDWNFWEERWKLARENVLNQILGLKLANPLVNDATLPAQAQFDAVQKAIGTPKEIIALSPLIARFQAETGQLIDEKNRPMPTGYDPDLAAYKKVDEQVKAGEAAAKAAGHTIKEAAKSNTGLLILGGAGLALAGVIAVKVYL